MLYTETDVMDYIEQEDVKFIRLVFTDMFRLQKNISIMPKELPKAFRSGISFDASAIRGFAAEDKSDLLLFPDPATLAVLPWRPAHGRVVRLFCDIRYPDGTPFEKDCRYILKQAVRKAKEKNILCRFGAEFEFYLLKTDETGEPTAVPFDRGGYMDVGPLDRGENVRREICLTLEEMGILPETSHHEEGPGQNEIDFKYSDALEAADNAITFKWVVRTIAVRNGLHACFSPKPFREFSGNGCHINMSINSDFGKNESDSFMAGVLSHIKELTLFLNSTEESYRRLGEMKAPRYISWSYGNRSELIRIPAATGEYQRFELRSPDPEMNPYLAYALLIHAGLDGIEKELDPPDPVEKNMYRLSPEELAAFDTLPASYREAAQIAESSGFVREIIPEAILEAYRTRYR